MRFVLKFKCRILTFDEALDPMEKSYQPIQEELDIHSHALLQ